MSERTLTVTVPPGLEYLVDAALEAAMAACLRMASGLARAGAKQQSWLVLPAPAAQEVLVLLLKAGAHAGEAGPILGYATALIGAVVLGGEPKQVMPRLWAMAVGLLAAESVAKELGAAVRIACDESRLTLTDGVRGWSVALEELTGQVVGMTGPEWRAAAASVAREATKALRAVVVH